MYSPRRTSPGRSPSRSFRSPTLGTPSESRNGRQMRSLLSEFRSIYETKLRKLDELEYNGEGADRVSLYYVALLGDSNVYFER